MLTLNMGRRKRIAAKFPPRDDMALNHSEQHSQSLLINGTVLLVSVIRLHGMVQLAKSRTQGT